MNKQTLSKIILDQRSKKILKGLEETNLNIFITGRAGTGKSTLLELFRKKTAKNVVVLAPTGVAALNVKGQTIHSFFKLKPGVTLDEIKKQTSAKSQTLYKSIDTIIIDEISMVRADLFDCIDKFMRLNGNDESKPFGGVQMIVFGDLYQLPPIVTREEEMFFKTRYDSPYFFSADVFNEDFTLHKVELRKIYRQKNEDFIQVLNKIREKKATTSDLELINSRYQSDLYPDENDFYIYLSTTNKIAEKINEEMLGRIDSEPKSFKASVSGNFVKGAFPAPEKLTLKTGAQVMLLNNETKKRWVNGSIGRIKSIAKAKNGLQDTITVELDSGSTVEVTPNTWENISYFFNEKTKKVEAETLGVFVQFPMQLAWAVTIHKSQGKTFEKVVIDLGWGAFAHGQAYVALSRCTNLEGVILKRPIEMKDIIVDAKVREFFS